MMLVMFVTFWPALFVDVCCWPWVEAWGAWLLGEAPGAVDFAVCPAAVMLSLGSTLNGCPLLRLVCFDCLESAA